MLQIKEFVVRFLELFLDQNGEFKSEVNIAVGVRVSEKQPFDGSEEGQTIDSIRFVSSPENQHGRVQ